MISRTRTTATMAAVVVAAITIAAGAGFGFYRLGQRDSRVGHFPAVSPAKVPLTPSTTTGGANPPLPHNAAARPGHDPDD